METDDTFDSVQWGRNDSDDSGSEAAAVAFGSPQQLPSKFGGGETQAGPDADAVDLAGVGSGKLITKVSDPQVENEGTKDAFVSYLVTTETDFPTFQKPHVTVRRRFTDFVYLFTSLSREFPHCAVPPLPSKHALSALRASRFTPDFTLRRASSLHRFLARLTRHPVLRRTPLLMVFLETPDWHAHMKMRPLRSSLSSGGGSAGASGTQEGVFDGLTDTFLNAFAKVHKADARFVETRERADKLDEDLGHVEKIVARVVRRDEDLSSDYAELAREFARIGELEPELAAAVARFAGGVAASSDGLRKLKEHTDQDYLSSLRDMAAYILSLKGLLKTREQKQLDFEALSDYLARAASERDQIASGTGNGGAGGFLRNKIEDVRGIDHEAQRRARVRRLEGRIDELMREVESARILSEAFDEEVVREVHEFERIKEMEMKETLGGLAQANVRFYTGVEETWQSVLAELEKEDDGEQK